MVKGFCALVVLWFYWVSYQAQDLLYTSYTVDPSEGKIQMFWKTEDGHRYHDFINVNDIIRKDGKELVFAMNGGMYTKECDPLGLYVENGEQKNELNLKKSDYGNFYLEPNGVFFVNKEGEAGVIQSRSKFDASSFQFASQSGPMLVIEGEIHGEFNPRSSSKHIRNGVGILPNGDVVFAISNVKVSLYEFAEYFKNLGCRNALYLDGFVSKCYYPEKNIRQSGGKFGVIIGVVESLD